MRPLDIVNLVNSRKLCFSISRRVTTPGSFTVGGGLLCSVCDKQVSCHHCNILYLGIVNAVGRDSKPPTIFPRWVGL